MQRDEHGQPQFKAPAGKPLSPRALHAARCFYLGVRNPEDVQRTWDEIQATKKPPKPARRRRP